MPQATLDTTARRSTEAIDTALKRIFSDKEQTESERVRQIMGDALTEASDEEVETYLIELQHLIDSWLDVYERTAFDGQTLLELLG
ncbi:MAG: hypothetical protein WDN27_03225 [Candidatus Saccharibacteria bacterium]